MVREFRGELRWESDPSMIDGPGPSSQEQPAVRFVMAPRPLCSLVGHLSFGLLAGQSSYGLAEFTSERNDVAYQRVEVI
jgi:hypothetical protein